MSSCLRLVPAWLRSLSSFHAALRALLLLLCRKALSPSAYPTHTPPAIPPSPSLASVQQKGKLLKKRTIAATRERRQPAAKRPRLDEEGGKKGGKKSGDGGSSDEYDSEPEVKASVDDLAFIDEEDDDQELLAEYKRDRQDFDDEAPLVRGRKPLKKSK